MFRYASCLLTLYLMVVECRADNSDDATCAIITTLTFNGDFGNKKTFSDVATGHGVCVSPKGFILSNNHLVNPSHLVHEVLTICHNHDERAWTLTFKEISEIVIHYDIRMRDGTRFQSTYALRFNMYRPLDYSVPHVLVKKPRRRDLIGAKNPQVRFVKGHPRTDVALIRVMARRVMPYRAIDSGVTIDNCRTYLAGKDLECTRMVTNEDSIEDTITKSGLVNETQLQPNEYRVPSIFCDMVTESGWSGCDLRDGQKVVALLWGSDYRSNPSLTIAIPGSILAEFAGSKAMVVKEPQIKPNAAK